MSVVRWWLGSTSPGIPDLLILHCHYDHYRLRPRFNPCHLTTLVTSICSIKIISVSSVLILTEALSLFLPHIHHIWLTEDTLRLWTCFFFLLFIQVMVLVCDIISKAYWTETDVCSCRHIAKLTVQLLCYSKFIYWDIVLYSTAKFNILLYNDMYRYFSLFHMLYCVSI